MTHHAYRFLILFLCGLLFYQTLSFSACADQWEFQLAPYAWLSGQNGTVATLPGLPPANVDVDFYDDIWGNINLAGMLVGEARKGRFGPFTDIVHTDIEMEDPALYRSLFCGRNATKILDCINHRIIPPGRPIKPGFWMPSQEFGIDPLIQT